MLRCAENYFQFTSHRDSHFADLVRIMSKQFEETIDQNCPQQCVKETTQTPSQTPQYEGSFQSFYPETYFPNNPTYSPKSGTEIETEWTSLELTSPIPGPSGVTSTQAIMSIRDLQPLESSSVPHLLSSDGSYMNYSKQDIGCPYQESRPAPSEPYTFYNESTINIGPEAYHKATSSGFPPPEISPTSDSETTSSSARVPIHTSQLMSPSSSPSIKTSPARGGFYKSFRKPRRGRRRGYRRGGSMGFAARTPSGIAEEVKPEAIPTRDIYQEAQNAYVQITEQPRPKALRFRYICEGRSAGSIPGVTSTPGRKSFPSIRVVNSSGPAIVVVSCVTVTRPHRPHPHNLVGKEGCEDGVCSAYINSPMMEYAFSNLGIQCVKKRDIEASLSKRQLKGIDPFGTGFDHRKFPHTIDLNSIRLCFQVYLIDSEDKMRVPLEPVVSDPIYDKKATTDLVIYKLSSASCCVSGRKEIILLCDKISKDDIKVRFYEEKEGITEWEAFGEFTSADVHKQVAILFKTPQYKDLEIKQAAKVWIQLFRPSDKSTSEPVPFEYYPVNKDENYFEDKILHVVNPPSKDFLTCDSPVESVKEASDESEFAEDFGHGSSSKPFRTTRSSTSHSGKIRSQKTLSQETYPLQIQTRLMASRMKRQLSTAEKCQSSQRLGLDQVYFPQSEDIQRLDRGIENVARTPRSSLIYPFASCALPPSGPAATFASTAGALSGNESDTISLLDMDKGIPSALEIKEEEVASSEEHRLIISIPDREATREQSLSPNSESIKRLKHDIETLNRLSNL